jgi:hypothetical protein
MELGEVEAQYNKLKEYFGDSLADPIHEPRVFAYQVQLYNWQLNRSYIDASENRTEENREGTSETGVEETPIAEG